MRKIKFIQHVEMRRTGIAKNKYWRTYAVLDDGMEAVGYGQDFKVGDEVEVFQDAKWDVSKMRHGIGKDRHGNKLDER